MIKAVFFDAAGTLLHLHGSVGQHYAAVARELGVDLSADALDQAFARAWTKAPRRQPIERARDEDDKPWWRDLVNAILSDLPNMPAVFDRAQFFALAYAHFAKPGVWALYPEVVEVLGLLARKFPLGIISNFDRRLREILLHLGIASFFCEVFISSELGADKPDPEIYRRVLSHRGLSGAEALHVGDDPERDWQAAAEAGMRVFRLERPRNSLFDVASYLGEMMGGRNKPRQAGGPSRNS